MEVNDLKQERTRPSQLPYEHFTEKPKLRTRNRNKYRGYTTTTNTGKYQTPSGLLWSYNEIMRVKYFLNHRINDYNQKLRWEITLLVICPQGTSDISCCFESFNHCYSYVECYQTNGNQSLIIICYQLAVSQPHFTKQN